MLLASCQSVQINDSSHIMEKDVVKVLKDKGFFGVLKNIPIYRQITTIIVIMLIRTNVRFLILIIGVRLT
jgi:hypothetical protein